MAKEDETVESILFMGCYRAALFLGEADLSLVMDLVNGVSVKRQQEMSEQGFWLYNRYFSTIESITLTTLDIINDRTFPQHARVYEDWNFAPHMVILNDFLNIKSYSLTFPPSFSTW